MTKEQGLLSSPHTPAKMRKNWKGREVSEHSMKRRLRARGRQQWGWERSGDKGEVGGTGAEGRAPRRKWVPWTRQYDQEVNKCQDTGKVHTVLWGKGKKRKAMRNSRKNRRHARKLWSLLKQTTVPWFPESEESSEPSSVLGAFRMLFVPHKDPTRREQGMECQQRPWHREGIVTQPWSREPYHSAAFRIDLTDKAHGRRRQHGSKRKVGTHVQS